MKLYTLLLLFVLSIFTSCDPIFTDSPNNNFNSLAYVPVYAQVADINTIGVETAKPTAVAGKIYAYGNTIFQNDSYTGFHIINNTNPANAQKIGFLKVPFSTEIAIKGNYLYTNNVSDLVVFDISNPANPVLIKRVKDAFPVISQTVPPVTNTYFECPDPKKGIIVRWEQKTLATLPNCRR
jgi:hypothetical protein